MPFLLSRRAESPRARGVVSLALLAGVIGGLLAVCVAVIAIAAAFIYPSLPSLDKVIDYRPHQPLQVFTRDGVEIGEFGAERRQYVPIKDIPPLMQNALLAVEDARFREHSGIDPIGIARAIGAALTGGMRQGASTITQQVARNFFLTNRRTPERKLKEALLALKIESQLSKDQILELYMNQIYLGQRAYGFAAAAQVYFGKPLAQLSPAEAAMLAGLPQNPNYANPVTNPARATARQQVVLVRMRDTGVITPAQFEQARAERLALRSALDVDLHAEYVAEMARRVVVERWGEQAYTQGLKVTTSLIAADQRAAWTAVRRGLIDYDRKRAWRGPEDHEELPEGAVPGSPQISQLLKDHRDDEDLRVALVLQANPREVTAQLGNGEVVRITGEGLRWVQPALSSKASSSLALVRGAVIRVMKQKRDWVVGQWPEAQAGLVSLDPATGRVRALVGGFDFTRNQFNHVTQAWRQPGSSFKPFLYSAALERGVMPATVVNDAPLTTPDGNAPTGWNPQNSDGRFDGPMTLRQALAKSKNLVSIRVVQQTGVNEARQWAGRFGFDVDKQPDNLTLALGAGSVTPMQLATGYAVLANGGYRVDPVVVERVTDAQGQVLYLAPAAPALDDARRVVPARNVFVMNSLLQEVARSGTAARAQAALKRSDIYGKTGTTNDAVDAWFAGFQPGVAAVVWMGFDDPRSLGQGESGGGLSLPIWIGYMEQALKGVPVQKLEPPEGVVEQDGDWLYAELPDRGWITRIDVEEQSWWQKLWGTLGGRPSDGGASAPPAPIINGNRP